MLHHPEYRDRYAANLKRELPRIPFVGAGVSPGFEGAGLQASRKDALDDPSTLPKASAQPKAERPKETADPSARAEALARDDNSSGSAGLQAGVQAAAQIPSTLPKASAQPARAERPKKIFWAFVEAGRQLADLHVNYKQQQEYPLERVEKGQLNWRVEKMRLSKDKTTLVYNDFLTLKGIPPESYEYRLGNRSALEWVIDQYQVSTDKRSGIVNDPNRADDPQYIVRLIGQVITVSLKTMKIVKSLPALQVVLAESSVEASKGASND